MCTPFFIRSDHKKTPSDLENIQQKRQNYTSTERKQQRTGSTITSKANRQTPTAHTSTLDPATIKSNNVPKSSDVFSFYKNGVLSIDDSRFIFESSLTGSRFFEEEGGKEGTSAAKEIETLRVNVLYNDIRVNYHAVLIPKYITGQILGTLALPEKKIPASNSLSKLSVNSTCLRLPKPLYLPSSYNLPPQSSYLLPLATCTQQRGRQEISIPTPNLLQQFNLQLLFTFFVLMIEAFEGFRKQQQGSEVTIIVLRKTNLQRPLVWLFFVFMKFFLGAGSYGRRVPPDERTSPGRVKSSGGWRSGSNDDALQGGRRSERITGGSTGGGGGGSSGGGGGRDGDDGRRRLEGEESQSDSNEEEEEEEGSTKKKKKRRRRPRLSTIPEIPWMLPVDAPAYMPFPNIPMLPHETPLVHEPQPLPLPPLLPLPLPAPQAAANTAPNATQEEREEPRDRNNRPVFKEMEEESAHGQASGSACAVSPRLSDETPQKTGTHHPCLRPPAPPSPTEKTKAFHKNKSASMQKHSPYSASHPQPEDSHTPPYNYSDDSGVDYVPEMHVLVSGRTPSQQGHVGTGGPCVGQEEGDIPSGACGSQAASTLPHFQQQASLNEDVVQLNEQSVNKEGEGEEEGEEREEEEEEDREEGEEEEESNEGNT